MRIPQVIAHRGYQRRFPENTMSAIRAAVAGGAMFVEIDVQLTADHVPVLLHDVTLDRMCGIDRPIHEVDSRELSQFRAAESGRLGTQFSNEPVATLKQCCEFLMTQPDVQLFVELKDSAARLESDQFVVESVLNDLQPVLGQCVCISFTRSLLQEVVRLSDCRIGPVIEEWSQRDVIAQFNDPPHVLFCEINGLPESGPLLLEGTDLAVYEVPDAATALELGKRGVNYVETFAACELLTELNASAKNSA